MIELTRNKTNKKESDLRFKLPKASDLLPTSSIIPAISWPGTLGYWMPGNNPSLVKESLWHIPQACTLIRTCIGPGSGVFRSTISKGPLGLDTCTERIYHYFFLNIYNIWL